MRRTDAGETELVTTLRSRGQRATPQRIALLRALRALGRHASAEEVLREASDGMPTLSLPTVYATLELFEELCLVRRVHGPGVALYDPVLDGHPHFACRRCGMVVDLPRAADHADDIRHDAQAAGHTPENVDVVVSGLCQSCSRTEPRTSRASTSR